MISNSLPALPIPSDDFYDTMDSTNPTTMQVESASREQPHAEDALYGPGGYENITLRMESRELSMGNRISEDVARSELEAMERDARFSLFFKICNPKL